MLVYGVFIYMTYLQVIQQELFYEGRPDPDISVI